MKERADFQLDLVLDKKAVVTEDENGDLIIEGLASDFEPDRAEEAFEPGAFEEGLKSYLETNPILLYHHRYGQALGQVLEAKTNNAGLWVKARIDRPANGSAVQDIYEKVKRGTIRAFSVGGKFFRRMTPRGPRIYKADIAEISVTPMPVNPRTLFAVGQKAFGDSDPEQAVDRLEQVFEKLSQATVRS